MIPTATELTTITQTFDTLLSAIATEADNSAKTREAEGNIQLAVKSCLENTVLATLTKMQPEHSHQDIHSVMMWLQHAAPIAIQTIASSTAGSIMFLHHFNEAARYLHSITSRNHWLIATLYLASKDPTVNTKGIFKELKDKTREQIYQTMTGQEAGNKLKSLSAPQLRCILQYLSQHMEEIKPGNYQANPELLTKQQQEDLILKCQQQTPYATTTESNPYEQNPLENMYQGMRAATGRAEEVSRQVQLVKYMIAMNQRASKATDLGIATHNLLSMMTEATAAHYIPFTSTGIYQPTPSYQETATEWQAMNSGKTAAEISKRTTLLQQVLQAMSNIPTAIVSWMATNSQRMNTNPQDINKAVAAAESNTKELRDKLLEVCLPSKDSYPDFTEMQDEEEDQLLQQLLARSNGSTTATPNDANDTPISATRSTTTTTLVTPSNERNTRTTITTPRTQRKEATSLLPLALTTPQPVQCLTMQPIDTKTPIPDRPRRQPEELPPVRHPLPARQQHPRNPPRDRQPQRHPRDRPPTTSDRPPPTSSRQTDRRDRDRDRQATTT
jgi:roadblock/LC7 domain-containing protein